MPRYHAKKMKSIDFEDILEAIKSVKISPATAHNIPKSNLAQYIAAFDRAAINVANQRHHEKKPVSDRNRHRRGLRFLHYLQEKNAEA